MATEKLKEIAQSLVTFCREGQEAECLNTLYSEDAVSVEAVAMPGTESAEAMGLQAIRGKHDWWNNAMELHSSSLDGPFYHGDDRFAVIFEVDATDKESGERMAMKEVGIYTIAGDKIVREEFFYMV